MAQVLVVDDDLDSREAVARYLQKAGHATECASNGQEALTRLMADTPDVIILDVRMPEMDGVGFLEVIRCYLRWVHLPVILLTAYPYGSHVLRAQSLGVRRIFTKADYGMSELVHSVEQAASGHLSPEPPSRPNAFFH